jgi:hypothetical protein
MGTPDQHVPDRAIRDALALFELPSPPTAEQLEAKRRDLLATWHPARYANLTNNPHKYMESYKKAEAITKQINDAYNMLAAWLAAQRAAGS